jgi:hypothetical protein
MNKKVLADLSHLEPIQMKESINLQVLLSSDEDSEPLIHGPNPYYNSEIDSEAVVSIPHVAHQPSVFEGEKNDPIVQIPIVQIPFDDQSNLRRSSRLKRTRKIDDIAVLESSSGSRKKPKVAKIDQKNVKGVLYPKGPNGRHSEGASYEDFVDNFSQSMWKNPDKASIESALRIVFLNHQTKYGKIIIPDEKLSKFLQKAESLPVQWNDSDEREPFVNDINDDGWYKIENIVSKHELLLIGMMSLAATNFSVIRNRHGMTNKQETMQNRCVSNSLSFDFF